MGSINKPHHQLSMYDILTPSTTETSIEERVNYNRISVNQATFKAGLAARVHRWFRLTPSFAPDLVREMLAVLKCGPSDVVLDPFAGAGTTMIECQLEGLTSYGLEINPFLQFVGHTSLNWSLNTLELENHLEHIQEQFEQKDALVDHDKLNDYGLKVPDIHNPTRWWRRDILKQLLVLKSCIDSLNADESIRSLFRLALAGVLVPDLTNVTLGRLQLHFIDRNNDTIKVLSTFTAHAQNMISDVQCLGDLGLRPTSQVFVADATQTHDLNLHQLVNCVITSPPYPNRYSYVWNTRPHLYFFDMLKTPTEAADLDKLTIGGTWGSATSVLMKGQISAAYPVVQDIAGPVVSEIRRNDNLMANYAMKYFNLLAKQIVEMDRLLSTDARVAYVVGCSWLKGIYVETDVMLGKIMEGLALGYKVSSIERIRSRHSGKDLHESIVYAWKR